MMKQVPEIRQPMTITIAIGSDECAPAMPTSGAAIEAEKEKPSPSIAEPVPANSRASWEAMAAPLPKIMPCGATVKKKAGSTIQAGVSKNRLPISREKADSVTTVRATRMMRRGWMLRVRRAERNERVIIPAELIAKLME